MPNAQGKAHKIVSLVYSILFFCQVMESDKRNEKRQCAGEKWIW
jgi:hypothetical protein